MATGIIGADRGHRGGQHMLKGWFDSNRSHVRAFRRAILALGATALVAAIVRLRGSGGTPPQTGGWRELSGPDLR